MAGAIGEADRVEQLGDPVAVDAAPCRTSGSGDVLGGRERGQQVVGLEDEADAVAAQLREAALARPSSATPSMATLPEVGVSSPAMMCMSVDLPEPEGPMTATKSPVVRATTDTPRSASTAASPLP